jgi:hypothetical protein
VRGAETVQLKTWNRAVPNTPLRLAQSYGSYGTAVYRQRFRARVLSIYVRKFFFLSTMPGAFIPRGSSFLDLFLNGKYKIYGVFGFVFSHFLLSLC